MPVALAVAVVAQPSGQSAALRALEAAEEVAVAQPDAVAAPQSEEARVAGVAAEAAAVAEWDAPVVAKVAAVVSAAAVVQRPEAPDGRAQLQAALPSAAAWVFRQDRVRRRPAPQAAARFARAMKGLRSAAR